MKVKIFGDVVRLESSLKEKDFELLARFNKEIVIVDEKENEVFRINFRKGETGSVSSFGINYNSVTEEGYASISITLPGKTKEEIKDFLKTELAKTIIEAKETEAEAKYLITTVKNMQEEVEDIIEDEDGDEEAAE